MADGDLRLFTDSGLTDISLRERERDKHKSTVIQTVYTPLS